MGGQVRSQNCTNSRMESRTSFQACSNTVHSWRETFPSPLGSKYRKTSVIRTVSPGPWNFLHFIFSMPFSKSRKVKALLLPPLITLKASFMSEKREARKSTNFWTLDGSSFKPVHQATSV